MTEFFGVIEMEKIPYFSFVRIYADSIESAKTAYKKHCDKIGGYIYNLYPVHDGNRSKFQTMTKESFIPVPTVYAD